jgi:hypothetical protein
MLIMLCGSSILLSAFPFFLRQHALARNVPPQLLKVPHSHPSLHSLPSHISIHTPPFTPLAFTPNVQVGLSHFRRCRNAPTSDPPSPLLTPSTLPPCAIQTSPNPCSSHPSACAAG